MVDELLDPLRAVRRAINRSLHSFRRRAAQRQLSGHVGAQSLLVVCQGNICRSPFGAALLRERLPTARVGSAGWLAPERRVPRAGVLAALRFGVDLSAHRSTVLNAGLVNQADLILVMDPLGARMIQERFGRWGRDVMVLGDLDPEVADARVILDPINQPVEIFLKSYARIARCIEPVVSALRAPAAEWALERKRSLAPPEEDLVNPQGVLG